MLRIQLINANDKQYVSHLSSKRFYASLKIKEMFFGCTVTINETFISLEPLLDTKGLRILHPNNAYWHPTTLKHVHMSLTSFNGCSSSELSSLQPTCIFCFFPPGHIFKTPFNGSTSFCLFSQVLFL